MKKNNKIVSTLFKVLLSIFIIAAMEISLKPAEKDFLFTYNNKLYLVLVFYALYQLLDKINIKKINYKQLAFSFILSFINLVSYFYYNYHSLHNMYSRLLQVFKSFTYILAGTIVTYLVIHIIYNIMMSLKYKKSTCKTISFIFDKHPKICSFLILSFVYFIFLLILFPGICSGDTIDEIRQYNHVLSWSTRYINVIDPGIYINGHHSPFHTIIIGYIFSLFKNINIGFFVNCFIQLIFVSIILSYTFGVMKKLNTPYLVRIIILLIYLFFPPFLCGSITIIKDIPFSVSILLYCSLLIEYFYIKDKSTKNIILLLISSLLIALFSNKGIYLLGFTTFTLLFDFKENKKILMLLIVPIVLYFSYSKLLLPALHITPGSPREMLTVPIQQISRVVVEHDNDLSKKDKKTINEIIKYNKIKKYYNPVTVDPVKNLLFDKNYTKDEMRDFLKLWISLGFKYPKTYIEAALNQYHGYFYLERPSAMSYYNIYYSESADDNIKEELKSSHPKMNYIIKAVSFISRRLPVFGLIMTVAFYVWVLLLLILYILFYKKIKYIVPLAPSFVIFIFIFVSPVSGNFRYVLPIIFCMPILFCYMLYIMQDEKTNRNIKR